jgi:hypothetical protein
MTEEDYQRQLDANPKNVETRQALAEWLDKCGDARGPGYRALAVRKRWPLKSNKKDAWWWSCISPDPTDIVLPDDLWNDWFLLLPAGEGDDLVWPVLTVNGGIKTRRECEDAAALAFAKLPPERQAELLVPEVYM